MFSILIDPNTKKNDILHQFFVSYYVFMFTAPKSCTEGFLFVNSITYF